MINQVLASIAAALFVGDLHTTSEIIKKGRNGSEDNPLLGWLNDHTRSWDQRFWALTAVKVATIGAVLWVGFTQDHWSMPYVLAALDLMYGYVVLVNNYAVYRKLKR